uniref:BRX domain-containing protein n=1 Tax=Salix viminalis TaxID=40686 RepID=A0A6N2MUA2_SALVM
MLTCIACSKRLNNGSLTPRDREEDADVADLQTLRTKHALKALTAQIKDMAVKASGAYRNCKPCSGSSSNNNNRNYAESDAASDSARFHCLYRRAGSSNSTPRNWGKGSEARLKGLSSGEGTPASVSGRTESVVFMEEDEPKEWVAQVEPGVLITFVSLPDGGNDLKRIRFSREMFNKWQAQRWWAENYDKVMELYNVRQFNHQSVPLPTSPRSEDESSKPGSAKDSPMTPPLGKERPRNFHHPSGMGYSPSDSLDHQPMQSHQNFESAGLASTPKLSNIAGAKTETSSIDGSVRTSMSRESDRSEEPSISNASDMETEWVEQDEPGVYITIRALPGGTRELRRVRFRSVGLNNLEKYGMGTAHDFTVKHSEKHVQGCGGRRTEPGYMNSTCTDEMVALGEARAKLLREENRSRIHEQYL